MPKVSYLAILIAVIANFALGGIWYQFLFRNHVRREFTAKYKRFYHRHRQKPHHGLGFGGDYGARALASVRGLRR